MKFLLFFISFIFSLIFYIFHKLSIGEDIFGDQISNSVNLISFSNNLLIESFIFLFIGIIFLYKFSNFKNIKELEKNESSINILDYKYDFLYFIFYACFIYILYFINFNIDIILFISILLFILSDILFNHISKIFISENIKINIKYIGLILNYISSSFSVYYIINNDYFLISLFIIIFNIFLNLLIHKNYINYISLFIAIGLIGFLFYILYFWLFELYILYI